MMYLTSIVLFCYMFSKSEIKTYGKSWMYSIQDSVRVKYLSLYDGSPSFFDSHGYLKAPSLGPLEAKNISKKLSTQSFLKKYNRAHFYQNQCTPQERNNVMSVTVYANMSIDSLLYNLMRNNNSFNNSTFQTMYNRGAVLVIIEGYANSLNKYNDINV